MKHRFFAAACAVLLTACSLAGCADSKSGGENITSDEMPYGATIAVDWSRGIPLAYDTRFLEGGVLDKIYDYYHAIESKDGDLLKKTIFPLYESYQIDTVYEGKVTEQQIVEETYDVYKEQFGYDFDFAYIEITGLVTGSGQSGSRDSLRQLLDDIAKEKGEKKVSGEAQNLYELTVTRHVAKKGSGERSETPDYLTGETLYAIQYQNEWYLMYT